MYYAFLCILTIPSAMQLELSDFLQISELGFVFNKADYVVFDHKPEL